MSPHKRALSNWQSQQGDFKRARTQPIIVAQPGFMPTNLDEGSATVNDRKALSDITSQYLVKKKETDNSHLYRGTHAMRTRGITTRMAMNAVLNTGELLEKIMSYLPPGDLVKLRRINKNWHHIILTTPAFLTKMFLAPEPIGGFWIFDKMSTFLKPYLPGDELRYGEAWTRRQLLSRPTILNPMLFQRAKGSERLSLKFRTHRCEGVRLVASPDLRKQNSIYHDMFVTQPPVSCVIAEFIYTGRRAPRHLPVKGMWFKVTNRHGVRFRDLLNTFLADVSDTEETKNSDNRIFVKDRYDWKKSAVWMVGAFYATEKEIESVEKTVVRQPPPMPVRYSQETLEMMLREYTSPKKSSGNSNQVSE